MAASTALIVTSCLPLDYQDGPYFQTQMASLCTYVPKIKKRSGRCPCPHVSDMKHCALCDGSGLCVPNGRRKEDCRECGGTAWKDCEHGKLRRNCCICLGAGISPHGVLRQTVLKKYVEAANGQVKVRCVTVRDGRALKYALCEQNKRKQLCSKAGCGGCVHGNLKTDCRQDGCHGLRHYQIVGTASDCS